MSWPWTRSSSNRSLLNVQKHLRIEIVFHRVCCFPLIFAANGKSFREIPCSFLNKLRCTRRVSPQRHFAQINSGFNEEIFSFSSHELASDHIFAYFSRQENFSRFLGGRFRYFVIMSTWCCDAVNWKIDEQTHAKIWQSLKFWQEVTDWTVADAS